MPATPEPTCPAQASSTPATSRSSPRHHRWAGRVRRLREVQRGGALGPCYDRDGSADAAPGTSCECTFLSITGEYERFQVPSPDWEGEEHIGQISGRMGRGAAMRTHRSENGVSRAAAASGRGWDAGGLGSPCKSVCTQTHPAGARLENQLGLGSRPLLCTLGL